MNKRVSPILLFLVVVATLSVAIASGMVRRVMPTTANAEEQGLSVQLQYMQGVSTWGPTDVDGSATIWPTEQLATITVHLLPHLLGGQQYMWWVANAQNGDALRLGTFNTSFAGEGTQDVYLLQDLPAGADEVIVTVWHPGDSARKPGTDVSLAGLIPAPSPAATSTSLAAIPLPGATSLPTLIPGVIAKPGHNPTYIKKVISPVRIRTLPSTGGGPMVRANESGSGAL